MRNLAVLTNFMQYQKIKFNYIRKSEVNRVLAEENFFKFFSDNLDQCKRCEES